MERQKMILERQAKMALLETQQLSQLLKLAEQLSPQTAAMAPSTNGNGAAAMNGTPGESDAAMSKEEFFRKLRGY
jgi:hypothetical protein